MKTSVSFVAGLAVGAVGGVIAGAAYMKSKIEETIEERVDEEVKNFIDDYFARKEEEDEESDILEEEPVFEESYNSLHAHSQQNYNKPDPTKIFRDPLMEHPEEPEEETDILEENPVKPEPKEDDDMKDPKLISEDKFDEDVEFTKETLYYYNEDDVLTDEDEHEIENQLEIIGDTLDKFGFRDNEEQVVHVRNFERKTDYEVIKVFASFA